MEMIILRHNDGWIADDKRNALAYLKILESFEFIYALVTLQQSLMYLKEAVVKLHGEDQDLVSGVLLVEQTSDALQALRTDIDAYCSRILQHSSNIAARSNILVSMPRIAQRQQYAPIQNVALLQSTLSVQLLFHSLII